MNERRLTNIEKKIKEKKGERKRKNSLLLYKTDTYHVYVHLLRINNKIKHTQTCHVDISPASLTSILQVPEIPVIYNPEKGSIRNIDKTRTECIF